MSDSISKRRIPLKWKIVKCKDICKEITVGIVVKPASYYVEHGIPALRNLNIKEDKIDLSNLVYISEENNNTLLKKSVLREGDIVLTRTGTPGISCVISKELDGTNCIDLLIVKPKKEVVSSQFLSFFFNSSFSKKQIFSRKTGLAQQHLNVKALKELHVILPPIEEQELISDFISNVETIIQHTQLLIDKMKLLMKGLMQKLFSQGIGNKKFKETKIGMMPEEWKITELGNKEYFEILKSGIDTFTTKKEYLSTSSVSELRIVQIEKIIDFETRPSRANMQPSINSIWFAKMINTKKVYSFSKHKEEEVNRYILSTGFIGVKVKEGIDTEFMKYYCYSDIFNDLKNPLCTGAVQIALNIEDAKKITVPIPDIFEQKKISSILSNIKDLIIKLKNSKLIIHTHFQLLLQRNSINSINFSKMNKVRNPNS